MCVGRKSACVYATPRDLESSGRKWKMVLVSRRLLCIIVDIWFGRNETGRFLLNF